MVKDVKSFFINNFFGEDYYKFDEIEKNYIETKLNYFINELKDNSSSVLCNLSETYTCIFRNIYIIEDNFIRSIRLNTKILSDLPIKSRKIIYSKKIIILQYLKKYFLEELINNDEKNLHNKQYLLTDKVDKLNISVNDFLILHKFGIDTINDLLNYISLKKSDYNCENVEKILSRVNIRKEIFYFCNQNELKEDNLIEILNLSIRSYNALKRNGINTIGNLISYTENELVCLNGVGKLAKDEIIVALKKNNLSLKKEIDHENQEEISKPLTALNLTNGVIKRLQKEGINTVGDLLILTRRDLSGIYGLNHIFVRKIELALEEANLSFKKEIKLDNNINELDLSDRTKEYLNNKKITTLEYLISLDKFDMLEMIITDKEVLNEIKEYVNYIFYDRKDKKITRLRRKIVI